MNFTQVTTCEKSKKKKAREEGLIKAAQRLTGAKSTKHSTRRCEVKITKKYKVASLMILSRIEGTLDCLKPADLRPTQTMIRNTKRSTDRFIFLVVSDNERVRDEALKLDEGWWRDPPKMSENDKRSTCWIPVWPKKQSRNES